MIIKEIQIVEGLYERKVVFSDGANLIYSKSNSCGKTTLIRFLLYALGYQIPSTKNIKFEKCLVRCVVELDDGSLLKLLRTNNYSITIEDENRSFALPEQQDLLHELLYSTSNKDILQNLLGAFYFDQEKGWTLLNRGVVIGNIRFKLDELIRGISDLDCTELISKEQRVNSDLSKYRQMYSIAQYRDSVKKSELVYSSYEEEVNAELQQLLMEKNSIEREISRVGQSIIKNKSFIKFVDEMKLLVSTDDGKQIIVTKDNIVGLNDSVDYLVAKKKLLLKDYSDVLKRIDKVSQHQKREEQQISFFESESLAKIFDRQIVRLPMNQVAIKTVIDELERERKDLREQILKYSRSNNNVVNPLYNRVVNYLTELGVGDSESITQKYLFTSNLKELSGAVLHKTVFAFKLGYIKEVEKKLGIILPIIMDSPKGKEVDENNIKLMMHILNRDFKGNQIIIASISEYDFDSVNRIVLNGRLITDLRSVE